jgi:hypothetical protein
MFILVFMLTPLFFGCGEETFETTPWEECEDTVIDIVEKFNESKEYLNNVGLPVKFSTETTFQLHQRLDGSGEEKTIKDTTDITLYYESKIQNLAEVVTKRYVDNYLTSEVVSLYDSTQTDGKKYTTSTIYSKDDDGTEKESTFYKVDNFNISDTAFMGILSECIFLPATKTLTQANQKTFKEINYYQLKSTALDSQSGLDALKDEFEENTNLYTSPKLYELYNKKQDYVLNFSSEFGLDESGYLNYFTFNYSVFDSDNDRRGERSAYLVVSLVTKLIDYGQDLAKPEEVEDKDFYVVNTFVDTVKQDNSYVIYRDSNLSTYNLIKAYKTNDGYFLSVIAYENNVRKSEEEKKYYFQLDGKTFSGYEIDINEKTYTTTDYDPLLLKFDYSKNYLSKGSSGYMFGTSENYTNINVSSGKINYANAKGTNEWYVDSWGTGLGEFEGCNFDEFNLKSE